MAKKAEARGVIYLACTQCKERTHLISEPLNGANMAELLLKQKSAANAG